MNQKAAQVERVSKKFSRSLRHAMTYAPRDIARNIMGLNRRSEYLRHGEFWAVDRVSFDLKQGGRIGLIGGNGSGKSTLLKMLNGILLPDSGTIRIRGRVGALIEVGAGFHPILTGRENIFVNGAILGMRQREIRKKFDDIVAFADIGDFLDSPVKFYSSGMYVRLGFSVAVHAEPDVLLIDEVLAVGDFTFQKKSFDRLESMVRSGTSVILVSHSMAAVQRLCPVAVLMDQGRSVFWGDSREASALYYRSLTATGTESGLRKGDAGKIVHSVPGSMVVYLRNFQVKDDEMNDIQRIKSGESVKFILKIKSKGGNTERLPRIAIRVSDLQTEELLANIQTPQRLISEADFNGEMILECRVQNFNLAPGMYRLETKIGGDGEDLHDIAIINAPLEVQWAAEIVDNMSYKGKVYLPSEWKLGNTICQETS